MTVSKVSQLRYPRIGTPCYATDQGIGILAKAFFDNGIITDPLIVNHRSHPTHLRWYPTGTPSFNQVNVHDWISKLDVLFCIETPFNWDLIPLCKSRGIRTVIVPMYECFQPHRLSDRRYWPDSFICASDLDMRYFDIFNWDQPNVPTVQGLNFPVSVPWKQRNRAEVFVHNAGHGGLLGRNGTQELLIAAYMVQNPVKIIVRCQDPSKGPSKVVTTDNNVTIDYRVGTIPYSELYNEGDVFILPDKFAGQSCPLEEARAAGMFVITSDRPTHRSWLPCIPHYKPFIPVSSTRRNRVGSSYMEFDEAILDPKDIAAVIDGVYGADISDYSLSGKQFAEERSWDVLRPQWLKAITGRSPNEKEFSHE